jgi:hypothetical protein
MPANYLTESNQSRFAPEKYCLVIDRSVILFSPTENR